MAIEKLIILSQTKFLIFNDLDINRLSFEILNLYCNILINQLLLYPLWKLGS